MKLSDSIGNLAAAMARAQAAMGAAHKDSNNPAFNSKYADLSSVVDAIKPHLNANGLAYLQFVQTSPEGVGVETIITHASGEWIGGEAFFVPVAKANAHGFGSALTYARRYSLSAACGLKADDDDGNGAASAPPPPRPNTAKQVAVDEFDSLPPEAQKVAQEWAMEAIAFHEDGKTAQASAFLLEKCDTTESQLAVWALIPSNVRSAINKHRRERIAA